MGDHITMFRKVLVANRGVAACRILRTLRRMGIASVAVYSEADRYALHVDAADEAVCIGPAAAAESYLRIDRMLEAARATGAEAVHPGYGFLAENADLAEACQAAGLVFVGPTPEQIRTFGLKHRARELAQAAGVPLLPGSPLLADAAAARQAADAIGYPVMLKSTAGGGGIGLVACADGQALEDAFDRVARLAANSFGNAGLFVERAVSRGRHIEVQVFGDGRGRVAALGDRDCSAQRRHQKIVEETPSPGLPAQVRTGLHDAARRLCESVSYASAGTVEFIYDVATETPYFLEVNTRLQVEHGVTEAVLGIDLVEWMLRQAVGEDLPVLPEPPAERHAIQVRLYAEDPAEDFRPAAGLLSAVCFPESARVDACVASGHEVTPFYDSMLATVIAAGADRPAALAALRHALAETRLEGIQTNLAYLRHLLESGALDGEVTTATLAATPYAPPRITVLAPGTQTTVQDYPGRLGFWHVGVPPSGPMDDLSFRLANRAVGNAAGAAGLEIVVAGPSLRFDTDAVVCLAGAELPATLDGVPVPYWRAIEVRRGTVLSIGTGAPAGARAYLAVRGGLEVPEYLGSRATFTLGGFGGVAGRALLAGDVLVMADAACLPARDVPFGCRPVIVQDWEIAVLDGPHGAPEFFTDAGVEAFYAATWRVHYNSSRTGVRLIGPRPEWARADGGEAGLHPSNIHDTPYAIGSVDFTGDMPVILGPDGPSLGGFVCPVVVVRAELWKLGQLRAGDAVRFRPVTENAAAELLRQQDDAVRDFATPSAAPAFGRSPAILRTHPAVTYRRSGDNNILVEFGAQVLDLELRLRVHMLMQSLQAAPLPGIIDLTPGIRALQVHFDPRLLPAAELLATLEQAEAGLPDNDAFEVPSRIVHLPLSWDDPATRLAIERYMRGVRPDAPWCPSNIEFIRRINGLDTVDEVKRIVLGAEYLVLGLGDVYLGAPVATPLDPRHRLVTTKYNPARTWTPENAVGIGGAYLCVYGMEGPGGYQFVGRTCQMWNRQRVTPDFQPGQPWLLRFFDRIRFHEVDADTLLRFRDDFRHGRARLQIEPGQFRIAEYRAFLAEHADSIATFKARQQAAFLAERARWMDEAEPVAPTEQDVQAPVPPLGHEAVPSPVAGGVWKLLVAAGDVVRRGQTLLVLEAMKAEIAVNMPCDGRVMAIHCTEGQVVAMGQVLVEVQPDAAAQTIISSGVGS